MVFRWIANQSISGENLSSIKNNKITLDFEKVDKLFNLKILCDNIIFPVVLDYSYLVFKP